MKPRAATYMSDGFRLTMPEASWACLPGVKWVWTREEKAKGVSCIIAASALCISATADETC